LPVSVASGESTFNVLEQVKKYYRSTTGQDRLNGFATLNINCDLAQKLEFSSTVNSFLDKKARIAFVK
jgi:hypothetical protein